MRRDIARMAAKQMKTIFVYRGFGAHEEDSAIILRKLKYFTDDSIHQVSYVTPEEIKQGALSNSVTMLAIGGGFDLGLIKALGTKGMSNIRNYVTSGGSYLGICSGAYFACDYIQFDKGGPQEVVGERFLKFFPGTCVGPMYKPYDYHSRKGAVASLIENRQPLNCGDLDVIPSSSISPSASNSINGLPDGSSADYDINNCRSLKEDEIVSSEGDRITGQSYECWNSSTISVAESRNVVKGSSIEDAVKEIIPNGCACSPKRNCSEAHSQEVAGSSKSCNKEQSKNGTGIENQFDKHTEISWNSDQSKHNDTDLTNGDKKSQFRVFFNGGGCFISKDKEAFLNTDNGMVPSELDHKSLVKTPDTSPAPDSDRESCDFDPLSTAKCDRDTFGTVTVLSRYTDLKSSPVAAVKCRCGEGVAVLSGVHFEHDAEDIDDGDKDVLDIILDLKNSVHLRNEMFRSILQHLNV